EAAFAGIDPPISYPRLVHEEVAVEAHQFEEDPVELIVPGSHRSSFLLFLELPDLRSGRWWDLLLALDTQCGHQLAAFGGVALLDTRFRCFRRGVVDSAALTTRSSHRGEVAA